MSFLQRIIDKLKNAVRMTVLKKTVIRSYVPAPYGEILFKTETGGIRLRGDGIPRSAAWMLGYNFRTKTYCYTDKTRVEGDWISKDVLISFGRSVFPVVNSSKPRVCLYYPEAGRSFFLRHDESENSSISNIFVICVDHDTVPDPDTHCLVKAGEGHLHVGTLKKCLMPINTAAFPPDILKPPDIIDVSDSSESGEKTPFCWYGIYDRKNLRTEALFPITGGLGLSKILDFYRAAPQGLSGEKHLFLVSSGAETVCSYVGIGNCDSPETEGTAKPFLFDSTYDSLLLKPYPVDKKKFAAFLRDKNGIIHIGLLPLKNLKKYHDVITGPDLPECVSKDIFRRFDPEETEITENGFWEFVDESRKALEDKTLGDSECFLLQKRIIFNLNGMILQASAFKNTYAPDPLVNEDGWRKLHSLMQCITDDIITKSQTLLYTKSLLLSSKYGNGDLAEQIDGLYIKFGNTVLCSIGILQFRIDIIEIKNNTLSVEGYLRIPEAMTDNDIQIMAYVNKKAVNPVTFERCTDQYIFGKLFYTDREFCLNVPLLEARYSIEFGIKCRGASTVMKKIMFSDLAPITNLMPGSYLYQNGYIIRASKDRLICSICPDKRTLAAREEYFIRQIRAKAGNEAEQIISMRKRYRDGLTKPKKKAKWLLMDRPDRADDNAEALFRYIAGKRFDNVESAFVLSKNASAYSELSGIGTVLDAFSDEHLMAFLESDVIISSQYSFFMMNPFYEKFDYFRDIIRQKKFIFLQHGVIKDNHGPAFGRYQRHYDGFVTSGYGEAEYIGSDLFHYSNGEVWLTGLPRFDLLRDDDRHIITIMPTWRKDLTVRVFDEKQKAYVWNIKDSFAESEFYKFYNTLINDDRLIKAAEDHNYTVMFMPHPHFLKKADLFENKHPDILSICTYDIRYRDLFAMSSLIVTDYSSAVFDFVYMHKPVIYCQFDKKDFYQHHTLKPGYFDYERDGFGDVVYTMSDTIDAIISCMETGCQMKEKYRQRVDSFFKYIDHSCCERVCEKIFALDREKTA